MIKIPISKIEQALNKLNNDWQVVSISSTGYIFLIVEVKGDIFLLFDNLLLGVVGKVIPEVKVYGYQIAGNGVFYYTEPLKFTSSVYNSKGIIYKLDEFVPDGKYKDWVKDYRNIVEDWQKENHKLNNLLLSHPLFNIRD